VYVRSPQLLRQYRIIVVYHEVCVCECECVSVCVSCTAEQQINVPQCVLILVIIEELLRVTGNKSASSLTSKINIFHQNIFFFFSDCSTCTGNEQCSVRKVVELCSKAKWPKQLGSGAVFHLLLVK